MIGDILVASKMNKKSNNAFYAEEERLDEEVTENAILFKTIDLQIKANDFQVMFGVVLVLFAFTLGISLNQNPSTSYLNVIAIVCTAIFAVILGILFSNYRAQMISAKETITKLKSDQASRYTERAIRKSKGTR